MSTNPISTTLEKLRVKIFADGANLSEMLEMSARSYIQGLTTNPTLMRKAGVTNYQAFAQEVLAHIRDKPVAFEVLSDEFPEMERQALELASWGDNVYVKIPVTNTRGDPSYALVHRLASRGVKINVTAITTLPQVRNAVASLNPEVAGSVSVFAGRIADTGVDPVPVMAAAACMVKTNPKAELIWASPRELLNVFQAESVGCHVITVTSDILRKLALIGRDLEEYSLDTVKMFYGDATAAGFSL
jgi:transaldolase